MAATHREATEISIAGMARSYNPANSPMCAR
jgi:hypothetical protein